MVSKTKPDESFAISQFLIECFGLPYEVDRNVDDGHIKIFFI